MPVIAYRRRSASLLVTRYTVMMCPSFVRSCIQAKPFDSSFQPVYSGRNTHAYCRQKARSAMQPFLYLHYVSFIVAQKLHIRARRRSPSCSAQPPGRGTDVEHKPMVFELHCERHRALSSDELDVLHLTVIPLTSSTHPTTTTDRHRHQLPELHLALLVQGMQTGFGTPKRNM